MIASIRCCRQKCDVSRITLPLRELRDIVDVVSGKPAYRPFRKPFIDLGRRPRIGSRSCYFHQLLLLSPCPVDTSLTPTSLWGQTGINRIANWVTATGQSRNIIELVWTSDISVRSLASEQSNWISRYILSTVWIIVSEPVLHEPGFLIFPLST